LCDIDFFKKVKGKCGHDTGGFVLAEVAKVIKTDRKTPRKKIKL
jgi:PleD family two-component response regulator